MVDQLLAALIAATWKGSLLILAAAAVHGLFGDRIPAKWRHAILAVAMLRLLIPFGPAAPFSVFNLAPENAPQIVQTLEVRPAVAFRIVAPPPPGIAVAVTPAPSFSSWWRPVVAAVWAAGVIAFLLWVARGSIVMSRRLRGARELASGDPLVELLESCRHEAGMRRRVRLLVTDAIDHPSLHGLFRPSLLLPPDVLQAFTREELRFVFLHELAHLRRQDVVLNWVTAFVHALHWFNPLVWIAVARLDEDRELACDALALEQIGRAERTAYGQTVLRMLDHLRAPYAVPGLVGMTTTKQQVKRRMLMIATFRNDSRRTALFGALVVLIAAVTLTDARAAERERFEIRTKKQLSPAAKTTFERLDTLMHFALRDASVQDVMHAVSNATGVAVKVAEGVTLPQTPLTLKANDVPARVVLLEALAAVKLGAKFEDGVTVINAPLRREFLIQRERAEAEGRETQHKERVVIVKEGALSEADAERLAAIEAHQGLRRDIPEGARRMTINVDAVAEDGVIRRKVKYRGTQDGVEKTGTLEIELPKQQQ